MPSEINNHVISIGRTESDIASCQRDLGPNWPELLAAGALCLKSSPRPGRLKRYLSAIPPGAIARKLPG